MMLTNRAARAGLLDGVAVGTWRCAIAFGSLGRRKLAYRYMDRALEAADLMSDAVEVARLKQGLALIPFGFGTWDDARAQAQLGMDLGGAVGDLRSWGTGCGVLTWAAINHGDAESARSSAESLARAGAEGGDQQIHGFGVALVGIADLYRVSRSRRLPGSGRRSTCKCVFPTTLWRSRRTATSRWPRFASATSRRRAMPRRGAVDTRRRVGFAGSCCHPSSRLRRSLRCTISRLLAAGALL